LAEQYFARKPSAAHRAFEFTVVLRNRPLRFHTDSAVFSRRDVDAGTRLLIDTLPVGPSESLLDLGCGYGPIGVAIAATVRTANVVMTDVNRRAVALARKNAEANGVRADVREGALYAPVEGLSFDHIASNPPIRAGKAVVHGIVEGAPLHLIEGGSLWLVARTAQGAPSLMRKMEDVFGNAEIVARGGGFRVLRSARPTILK
jgi:16S rRNA (guanine1207-N2)-methyltransferase